MSARDELEKELAKQLTEGELHADDPEQAAAERLSSKYEAVARAEKDPVDEETERYRELAEEVDDRYQRYGRKEQGNAGKTD